jgi:hypothetical protein
LILLSQLRYLSLRRNENGNTVLEFLFFLTLFLLPITIFFSQTTTQSIRALREEEMFREVVQILKSGEDFAHSVSISRRFLTLHNSSQELEVRCISGACPRRGSLMKITLSGGGERLEAFLEGGRWN